MASFKDVQLEEFPKQCATINGNFVLPPKEVVALVGNLDSQFVHHPIDFDYGFRAKKLGCLIWLAVEFIGTCSFHEPDWRNKNFSLREKLMKVNHPKGLILSEWKIYVQRHAGPLWPISPYFKLFLTTCWHSISRF